MRKFLPVILLSGLTLSSFLFLSSSSVSADETVSATATVTVGSACSLSSVIDTPHTATIPSGTNQTDIGQTTFTMTCNDTGGYSIYAVGYSNDTVGNNKLLATINGVLNSTYDISTGTNTSGTPSSWAMKLTPGTNLTASNILNGYGSYSIVPSSYVKVATLVPSTTPTISSSLSATYRVNISSIQPAGNYHGRVRYVMVNPNTNVPNEPKTCDANKICYWPNAGNEVTDSMGDQTTNYSDNTNTITSNIDVNLWPSNFQRDGYGFAGWSDKYDWVLNANDANGNGTGANAGYHIYGPAQNINVGDVSTNGLSLYAVWVKSEGTLQGWNGCSALGSNKVTALSDQRDGDTYAVAKLADGNCWMIENLRLDDTPELSSTNTDNPSLPLTNNDSTTSNHLSATTDPTSTAWCTTSSAACDDQSMLFAGNTASTIANMTGTNQNIYSYGNIYNWYSATAGNGKYSTSSGNAAGSICPAGWKLPSGTGSGDFGGLSNSLGGYKNASDVAQNMASSTTPTGAEISKVFRSFPNNFVYSGYVNGSSVNSRGSYGYYWSSTADGSGGAYYFYFYSTYVGPGTGNYYKYGGRSIRCIVSPSV